jgi:hypothetical protein
MIRISEPLYRAKEIGMGAAVFLLPGKKAKPASTYQRENYTGNRRSGASSLYDFHHLSYLLGNLILGHLGAWEVSEMGKSFPRN